jgi:hypothetical protein
MKLRKYTMSGLTSKITDEKVVVVVAEGVWIETRPAPTTEATLQIMSKTYTILDAIVIMTPV